MFNHFQYFPHQLFVKYWHHYKLIIFYQLSLILSIIILFSLHTSYGHSPLNSSAALSRYAVNSFSCSSVSKVSFQMSFNSFLFVQNQYKVTWQMPYNFAKDLTDFTCSFTSSDALLKMLIDTPWVVFLLQDQHTTKNLLGVGCDMFH